jgi:hypothetical protein
VVGTSGTANLSIGNSGNASLNISGPVGATRDFGNVSVSGQPANSTVTLANSGSVTTVTGFTPTGQGCGEFTVTALVGGQPLSPTNPATLANGDSLIVAVSYDPANRANDDCTFFVDQNGATSPNFRLLGDGIAPVLSVSPGPITFADQRWNGGAPEGKFVLVDNAGDEAIGNSNIQLVLANGTHFSLGAITGIPIFPGGSATVQVVFDPTSAGSKSDTLTISLDNDTPTDPNGSVSLGGTGTQSTQTFGASPFNVGSVVVGTSGTANLSIGNSGNASLNISGAPEAMAFSGGAEGDFAFADHGCDGAGACNPTPSTLDPGSSMPFALRCTPSAEGLRSATLTVRSDDPASPRTVTVNCTGLSQAIFSSGFEDAEVQP